MCGIVGAVSKQDVVSVLLAGLKALEYRGYDSAGIAVLSNGMMRQVRAAGKVPALVEKISNNPVKGTIGIAHTRWATHGVPSERNAHPHIIGGRIALVHNGIIENYEALKGPFLKAGYQFLSDTDSEVIGCCILEFLEKDPDLSLVQAVQETVQKLKGAYALCVMDLNNPTQLVGVRSGSPLVVGLGEHENFLASDTLALQTATQQFIYLEEGDIVEVTPNQLLCFNARGEQVKRTVHQKIYQPGAVDKGSYPHFMLKEIFEQPEAIRQTLQESVVNGQLVEQAFGPQAKAFFDQVQHVQIVACGTSFYAGSIARLWLEEIAGIVCQVEIASEFRYRKRVLLPNTLLVCISQSGETADTLAALRSTKAESYVARLGICNVAGSALMREADCVFLTHAGPEIGVCSTKAFSTQLMALFFLSLVLARRQRMSLEREKTLIQLLNEIPAMMNQCLKMEDAIKAIAVLFQSKEHALFLGRGYGFALALEGALKLKELSYIQAEAYPAGELKHGPLALVDTQMPVVVIAPANHLLDKIKSNIQEVRARGGEIIVLTSAPTGIQAADGIHCLELPEVCSELVPFIYTIPLQLLAYHVALLKGTDVDQPRNLAKSVTVE